MNTKDLTRNITKASTLLAIGLLLPYAFHALGLGSMFMPMYFPVLLAAFFLPLPFALAVAVLSPVLSSLMTNMPPLANPYPVLISMTIDLVVCVTVANLIYNKAAKIIKSSIARLYVALVTAILLGRFISIPAHMIEVALFLPSGANYLLYFYSLFSGSFIGLILLVLIVPTLVLALGKRLNPRPAPADYFNDRANTWDSVMAHDSKKIEEIVTALKLQPTDAVLDVGCGTGVLAPYLSGKCESVLAVDEAEKMIAVANAKYSFPDIEFKAVRFEDVAGKFDKIIMYSMFPHFQDQKAAVAHAAELLKKGGRLLIAHSQSRDKINAMHKNMSRSLPGKEEFEALFKQAGLVLSECADNDEIFYVAADKAE